jgi:hypothetical protein
MQILHKYIFIDILGLADANATSVSGILASIAYFLITFVFMFIIMRLIYKIKFLGLHDGKIQHILFIDFMSVFRGILTLSIYCAYFRLTI